jgi:hypothetical protein
MDPNVQSAAIIMRQYGGPDVLRLETVFQRPDIRPQLNEVTGDGGSTCRRCCR